MTFSIVAIDADAGVMGGAVSSCVLAIGPRVLFVEPGVGVVAAQAGSEYPWARLLLHGLRSDVDEALAGYQVNDAAAEGQVGFVTALGERRTHTAAGCAPSAGGTVGEDFAVQANLVNGPLWDVMAESFSRSTGPLAERLVAALCVAEAAGGDRRGAQSAAVVVVGTGVDGLPNGWPGDPCVDLRVDDARDPSAELRRLLQVAAAHELLGGRSSATHRWSTRRGWRPTIRW